MSSLLDALRSLRLPDTSTPLLAVVDAAKIEGLDALLFDHDLSAKPLYLDNMGSEDTSVASVIPQVVRFDTWAHWENDLSAGERVQALLDALDAADAPASACVFWHYGNGPDAAKRLYRHLRTLNNILIPRDPDTPPLPDPLDPDAEPSPDTATHQQVLFRHADANVVAQVFPELGTDRLARTLGPASGVICVPDGDWMDPDHALEDHPAVMHIANPADPQSWDRKSPAARTRLQLSERTMARIAARRLRVLRLEVAAFLRDMEPERCAELGEKALWALVVEAERVADTLGIGSATGYEMWAFFALVTDGESLRSDAVRDHFQQLRPAVDVMNDLARRLLELDVVTIDAALQAP